MNTREKAYNYIKNRARAKKEERQDRLDELRRDPYFDDLYRSVNSMRWDAVLIKDSKEREKAQAELSILENKMRKYLSEKKVPESLFSNTYYCEICHDTGVSEGKMCICAEKARIAIEIQESPLLSNIPKGLEEVDVNFYRGYETAYKKYLVYLQKKAVEGDLNFVVLTGKTGTGKSFLCGVCTKSLLYEGKSVKALNSIEMNKILLAYHCSFLESKQEIWDELTEPDVLFIDDLGVEPLLNNVTVPYLYALLIDRIDKKTFFTTNLDIRELEVRYGQRILSRLMDKRKGAIVPIDGKDYRL